MYSILIVYGTDLPAIRKNFMKSLENRSKTVQNHAFVG